MPARKWWFAIGCLSLACSAYAQAPRPLQLTGEMSPQPMVAAQATVAEPVMVPGNGGYVDDGAVAPADLPPVPVSWQLSGWAPKPGLQARIEGIWLQPDSPASVPLVGAFVVNPDNSVTFSSFGADQVERFNFGGRAT